MSVFLSLSNNVMPYNRAYDKEDFVNFSNLESILFKVRKRVYRSSLNIIQWRKNVFKMDLNNYENYA